MKTLFGSSHKHVLHKGYFLSYRIMPILGAKTTESPKSEGYGWNWTKVYIR
jgi:hypothetical protein